MSRFWRVDEYIRETSSFHDGVSEEVTIRKKYHLFKTDPYTYISPDALSLYRELEGKEEGAVILYSTDGFNFVEYENSRPHARIRSLEERVTWLEQFINSHGD